MRLYENSPSKTYDEIKTWYPVWYRNISEMDALWQALGIQLDKARDGIIQAVNNNFIDRADAETLSKLEKFFRISYSSPRTIIERRNMLKALKLGQNHIGQKEIKELISIFTGGKIDVAFARGVIEIAVTRDFSDKFNLHDCNTILSGKVPAHLRLSMIDRLLPTQIYNAHSFVFQNLRITLSVKKHGIIKSSSLCLKTIFKNKGKQVRGANLSGKFLLDGSIKLNSFEAEIFSGITPKEISVAGLAAKHNFSFSCSFSQS